MKGRKDSFLYLFTKIYDKLDFLQVEFDSFIVGSSIDKEALECDLSLPFGRLGYFH